MSEFVFTSPGAKFRLLDLTYVTNNVAITTAGLVGETLKGPAFEPINIQNQNQFMNRFGAQSVAKFPNGQLQYQLPYAANSYLNESNQLWVTRVLGLSGYDAGNAWAVTLSAGIDPSTENTVTTTNLGTVPFVGSTYLGNVIYATGQTGTTFTGYTKINATDFVGYKYIFTATTVTLTGGTVHAHRVELSGTSYSEYEGMVLAVVRSRGYVVDNVNAPPTTVFDCGKLTVTGNTTIVGTGDMFSQFNLVASGTTSTEAYTVSLNPDASNFMPNVVGLSAKDKNTKIWVQATYPNLIRKIDSDGLGYAINSTLIKCSSNIFTNYKTQFNTPETPWVVSQLKGSHLTRLFKLISISDGDAANQEIKYSISNINPITMEFDITIRSFYDTDASPIILETYTKCNMIKGTTGYVGLRIGTIDGEYSLLSSYAMVEIADGDHTNSFPAGFEGMMFNNYSRAITGGATAGVTPKVFYKTSYDVNEKVNRAYLGMSNAAYNGTNVTSDGINPNFFNFNGWINNGSNTVSGFTKTKGFHMDSGATGSYYDGTDYVGQFEVGSGSFTSVNDAVNPTNPYYAIGTRKFTFVPTGGFDGWDVNRTTRSYGDLYVQNGIYDGVAPNAPATNDLQAWETAINTFSNPEEVTINVFATPGINWSDQNVLVSNTISMIENQRTDTFYVIDSPDIDIPQTIGGQAVDVVASQEIADLLSTTGIDTPYGGTYFSWSQMADTQNNLNVYIPPTGEILRAMAYTDNSSFPWFAPAGLSRGVTAAKKSKYKLSLAARDILYAARINPMADFAGTGTAIFGQKTLQLKETALSRINVVRLLLQVKVLISNIAIRLVFEQNDQTTIDQFISKATPVLDTIKRERGLQDFRIQMDNTNNTPETNARNELYGNLYLKPVYAVEFIGITFTLTPAGASFAMIGG